MHGLLNRIKWWNGLLTVFVLGARFMLRESERARRRCACGERQQGGGGGALAESQRDLQDSREMEFWALWEIWKTAGFVSPRRGKWNFFSGWSKEIRPYENFGKWEWKGRVMNLWFRRVESEIFILEGNKILELDLDSCVQSEREMKILEEGDGRT